MRIGWLVAGWALGSAVRRLSQRTGVSDAEAYGTLPGDDVIPHPMAEWTRGVTVQAPPERIWPWLVQMGYGRAGWYTPAWVDRILEPSLFQLKTASPKSPDRLLPEFQSLAVGDLIADGPEYRSYWRVLAVEPQRAIVYRSVRHPWRPHPFDPSDPRAVGRVESQLIAGGVYLDFTWTFVLRAVGSERTRLLVRTRGNYAPWLLGRIVPVLGLFDATYGVAMLRAIARRAEALATTPATAGGCRCVEGVGGDEELGQLRWVRTACGGRPGLRPSRRSLPRRDLGQWPITSWGPIGGAHAGDPARELLRAPPRHPRHRQALVGQADWVGWSSSWMRAANWKSRYVIFALVLIHMLRVFFSGGYRGPRGGLWQIGVALAGTVFLLSTTGETLH